MSSITKQSDIADSEREIHHRGYAACFHGVCITENPHKDDSPSSLRAHWLWEQGWRYCQDYMDFIKGMTA